MCAHVPHKQSLLGSLKAPNQQQPTLHAAPAAGTCILFGDGCGAVLLSAAPDGQPCSLLGVDMHSDGNGQKSLHAMYSGCGGKPFQVGSQTHAHRRTNTATATLPAAPASSSMPSTACLQLSSMQEQRLASVPVTLLHCHACAQRHVTNRLPLHFCAPPYV